MTNSVNGIKIFEMNDCDWVAAKDMESAIMYYKGQISEDDRQPGELTSEQLDSLPYHLDGPSHTICFRAQLEQLVATGQAFPMLFASTEY